MHKPFFYLWLFLIPFTLSAQFAEHFTQSSLATSWQGNREAFKTGETGLALNAKEAGSSALIRKTAVMDSAVWIVQFSLDFAPSGSNYLKILLMTDSIPVKNGYILKIGESGADDAVELHRVNNGEPTLLIRGIPGFFSKGCNELSLKVIRLKNGTWKIYSQNANSTTWRKQGEATEQSFTQGSYTGVQCNYTATRKDKFAFRKFSLEGTPYIDSIKPSLTTSNLIPPGRISLGFSEAVSELSGENIITPHFPGIRKLHYRNAACTLSVNPLFKQNIRYTITLTGIQDKAGNMMSDTTLYFLYEAPSPHDILISELLPDPTPAITLPKHEFIELYNRSNKDLNLAGWFLEDPAGKNYLPEHLFPAGEHLILCSPEARAAYSKYGQTLTIPSLVNLNNGGDTIVLKDSTGMVIHALAYNKQDYNQFDPDGRSLILPDNNNPCTNTKLRPSVVDAGGSPGKKNSANKEEPPQKSLRFLRSYPKDSLTFHLYFNQSLKQEQNINIRLAGYKNINYKILPPFFNILQVTLPFKASKQKSTLLIDTLRSCSGDIHTRLSTDLTLPKEAAPKDLIINEVLFDPVAGGVDFVELYNNTSKAIDLKTIKLGRASKKGVINKATPVAPKGYLAYPGDYIVVTPDIQALKKHHTIPDQAVLIHCPAMANYPNKEGTVVLLNNKGERMETFRYKEAMHAGLLSNTEGVSLERLEKGVSSNDNQNWYSAASDAGYATPGKRNSNQLHALNSKGFAVPNEAFSPDGNGYRDFLRINYHFRDPGVILNLYIFDRHGNPIRHLYNNHALGTMGNLRWNGLLNNGRLALPGIYVLFFEYFSENGKKKTLKKHCVLVP